MLPAVVGFEHCETALSIGFGHGRAGTARTGGNHVVARDVPVDHGASQTSRSAAHRRPRIRESLGVTGLKWVSPEKPAGKMKPMSNSTSSHSVVTVTHLPVVRCAVCQRTVAHRPGQASVVLTKHYERVHPEMVGSDQP